MTSKAADYAAQSERYWSDAQRLLSAEDWAQASEKSWGSIADLVKACAEERGWRHDGHGSLFGVIGRLARETGHKEMNAQFNQASALHVNFYDNWLTPDQVAAGVDHVADLRATLLTLLHA